MAKYNELNGKGATLSDATALKDCGVTREFIIGGINAAALESRAAAIWGNPYIHVLRHQLESDIAERLDPDHLTRLKAQIELRINKRKIAQLRTKRASIEARQAELKRVPKLPIDRRS